jgi:peptidyl-prolyl cis-trans isomerase D
MTMLDRMRRHKAWLKWSLGIVVVAFVVLYIPSFLSPQGVGAAPTDTLATVESRTITVGDFQRAYQLQVMQLQQAYGGAINDQMLQQLGIAQQVAQQLIDEEAMVAEAERLGIQVTDAELRERIVRLPALQLNGEFVGHERYRQFLAAQRPPMREGEFEESLRRSLQAEKLERTVTGWLQLSDAEVDTEFRRRNEKVKLDMAVFTADRFREGIEPTGEEIQAHFQANTETYRVAEKRRVKYVAVDADSLRATVSVTPQEIEARYRENISTYSTPEQVRASHILFKTEGKDEAAVRKQAESAGRGTLVRH